VKRHVAEHIAMFFSYPGFESIGRREKPLKIDR
jgi:hypothetical protein